ncbi:serine hydrolase domain-containing protein [Streptomyces leeuwenhoekii]|uniref:serine hydrolase domain-containing protein n=1 Tax=Streptomyces leeuwenhoekii TaxID=1437453 RepID=UPI0036A05F30
MSLTLAGQDRPELRRAIEEMVESGFTGVTMRVHHERGEWVGSAGVRKLGERAKPPRNGHVRIGGNTKTFTATTVLQLVAEGLIGLDTPVADHLPEFGLGPRITVRMLLQHTGGVFNFTGEYSAGCCPPRCSPGCASRIPRPATAWGCSCGTRAGTAAPSSPTTAAWRATPR